MSNIGIDTGFDNGLDVTGKTHDQADNALLRALITALGKGKERPEKTAWNLSWTNGSTHPALRSFDTIVDKQFAFSMAPSPGDKQSMIALHRSLGARQGR